MTREEFMAILDSIQHDIDQANAFSDRGAMIISLDRAELKIDNALARLRQEGFDEENKPD